MAGFTAPENQGFTAPENTASAPPESSFLGDVVKQAGQAALFPLTAPAKPISAIAEGFVAPENQPIVNPEIFNPDPSKGPAFPNITDYPNQNYTSLGPTLDAFQAPFIAKDVAMMGLKGAKLLPGLIKGSEKAGLEKFLAGAKDINALPAQPELPLGPIENVRPPIAKAMNAPKMEEDIAGATTRDITAQAPIMGASNTPKIEVYSKGTMGKGPNAVTIWGVRGDPAEISKLGFGPDPASIPENILREKGVPLPGEVPPKPAPVFGETPAPAPLSDEIKTNAQMIQFSPSDIRDINKKGKMNLPVPAEQQSLSGIEANRGNVTAPIKQVTSAKEAPLPEGAAQRISLFSTTAGKDVAAANPLSTSSELATKTGKLEPVLRDQLQSGLKLEAEGERKANEILNTFKKSHGFEPTSLESQAISVYGRSPNKIAARQLLDETVGAEKASKIVKAEQEMRTQYNNLRERMNVERIANGEPPIPFKEDYFPQLHDMNLLNDLGLPNKIGTAEGDEIAKRIFTDNEQLKNSKFNHLSDIVFKHLKKQGVPDVEDAVTGYQKYVRESERKIALQPHVNELRQTAEAIKDTYPNLAKAYIDRADHIAGKVNSLDASIQNTIGNEAFNTFVEATNRMKKNLIQFNPHVPISQTFVLPSIAADLPIQDSMAGAVKALGNKEFRNFLVENSPTIQLRLAGREAQAINQGRLAALGSAPSDFVDSNTLLYAMAGKFTQLTRAGVPAEEAIKQAKQFASLTQSTLSKLNTAPILRSKTSQAALPFMNQVLSQARFVGTQLFKNKSLTEKAATAAKLAGTGLAIATATQLLLGDKAGTPLDPAQYVPMGNVLEQGIGGPLIGSAGRLLKAKSNDERLTQAFRTIMLLQNKIPGGLQVSKMVEGIFKHPKRSAD